MINDFFSQCFNSSVPPLSLSDIFSHSPADCPSDLLCTPENIIQLISQLPTHTSTGLDGISSKTLKATAYSISVPLCKLFNLSLSSGVFPMDWKTSLVIPIPKQSSPNPSSSNYHPISLLSLVSKLLERDVFDWLHNFCKNNNILSNNQFGFRSSFSKESGLITTTHLWFSLLDSNFSICAIFFDLCKAFDSIPHRPLLDTLLSYNIPPCLVNWIQSYLTHCSQQVVIDNSFSSKSDVISGVPQGTILGPLFFIQYINEISSISLPQSFSITLYVDDILLSCPYKLTPDSSQIQSSIDLLSSWLHSKHLTINPSKTKYMVISRISSNSPNFPILYLNGSPLERVYSFKYLGVILNSQLSWSPHIDYICSKTRKLLGFIFHNFYFHSSPSALLKLYLSLILPHLSYCSSLWDPYQLKDIKKLEDVQSFALKLSTKQWSPDYHSLLYQLSLPKLSSRRKISKFLLLYKFICNILFIPSNILNFQDSSSSHLRFSHHLNIRVPYSRTNSSLHYFFPSTSALWNSLPPSVKDSNSPIILRNSLRPLFK